MTQALMKTEEARVIRTSHLPDVLHPNDIVAQVTLIQNVMKDVMRDGEHYGLIPGCGKKPALLKSGAEKLLLTFRLDPQYESTETYEGNHLTVKSRCVLYHIPTGQRMGSGEGSCSTKESKYAWRQGQRLCPKCGKDAIIAGKAEYGGGWLCFTKKGGCNAKWPAGAADIESQVIGRIANEDLPDCYNTVLKMANKRSLVAGILNTTACSDIFTQDIEDLPRVEYEAEQAPMAPVDKAEQPASPPSAKKEPAPKKKPEPTPPPPVVKVEDERERPDSVPTSPDGSIGCRDPVDAEFTDAPRAGEQATHSGNLPLGGTDKISFTLTEIRAIITPSMRAVVKRYALKEKEVVDLYNKFASTDIAKMEHFIVEHLNDTRTAPPAEGALI